MRSCCFLTLPRVCRLLLLVLLSGPAIRAATFDLTQASIREINAAFAAGALTSEKLVTLYLARIAAYDQSGPKLNAIIALNPKALDEARALDAERKAGKVRGPLHGIPVLVKDNYDTFDLPTTGGSIGFKGATPAYDAFMVKKLREAGAIIIAKTNMDEMARGGNGVSSLGGQTLNPHRVDLIPGGSSAGTGSGLAAFFAPLGLGTETGGSVRHPANDNNIAGMVATEGLLSRAGIMPISLSQDRGGPMAQSVYDLAVALTVMAGVDPNDQITRLSIGKNSPVPYESLLKPGALKGKRLGVLRDLFKSGAEHEPYNQLILDAIAAMKKEGAIIIDPVSTGTDLFAMTQGQGLGNYEYKWAFNAYLAARGPGQPFYTLKDLLASGKFHERLKKNYQDSEAALPMEQSAEYAGKYRNRAILKKTLEELLVKFDLDAFVYPVRSGPLPAAGQWPLPPGVSGQSVSDYCGLPAITVPAGFTPDGTPEGIEFMGTAFEDAKLLQIAYGYEELSHLRKLPATTPPLPGEKFDY
jgi:Asp-tRNA(Asn)/Glu-tRNA(Gln) amidotransferase A subunit family amidase